MPSPSTQSSCVLWKIYLTNIALGNERQTPKTVCSIFEWHVDPKRGSPFCSAITTLSYFFFVPVALHVITLIDVCDLRRPKWKTGRIRFYTLRYWLRKVLESGFSLTVAVQKIICAKVWRVEIINIKWTDRKTNGQHNSSIDYTGRLTNSPVEAHHTPCPSHKIITPCVHVACPQTRVRVGNGCLCWYIRALFVVGSLTFVFVLI